MFIKTLPAFFYLQATAVFINEGACLILGPPGCGKSRLAEALIRKGGQLINDDLVHLERTPNGIYVHPLSKYAGILYLRGSGFRHVPYHTELTPLKGIILLGNTRLPSEFSGPVLKNIFVLKR